MTSVFRYELKIRKKVKKQLAEQHAFLIENGERLYNNVFLWYYSQYKTLDGIETKGFDSLASFFRDMGLYRMIENIMDDLKKVAYIGYKTNYRKHKADLKPFNVSFDIQNPAVLEYMKNFKDLHLSDRYGSISLTTKNAVIAELRKGVEQNLSHTEVAKNIQALDQTLFSFNRAKLIATNETGKAYEFGNYVPMKEAADQGATVEKKRLTVHDDRVTAQCRANEAQDRIGIDEQRQSGDDLPPRGTNPRCRCTGERKVL